jgi:hypothetical protein
MADNNQAPHETQPQTVWAELRECEKAWYMAYWAPVENNVRQEPQNNDVCQVGWNWAPPTELQLGTVIPTGDELVRVTHWRPTADQEQALLFWLEENPGDNPYN